MKHLLLTTIAAVVLVGCGNADNKPTREASQYSSIHEAAKEGDLNAIKWFLHGGINVNTAGSFRNASPLYMAAYSYDYEAAKLLLSYGANVHQLDFENETALHTAAYHSYVGEGDVKLVGLLIDHGANVNVVSDKRVTPLDWAMMFGTQEAADYLRKRGAKTNQEIKLHYSKKIKSRLDIKNARVLDETIQFVISKHAGSGLKDEEAAIEEIINLLRKHGGKTGEELKAEGK